MGFPAAIRGAIEASSISANLGGRGRFAYEHECEGAKFHSPTPLVVEEVILGDGTKVWLCPTCTANLDVFEALCEANDGELPWPVRREFGNTLRALGERRG